MKRKIYLTVIALISVFGIQAQVSYDSLVSSYPLNVNAKDAISPNDGLVFEAKPTRDRFNQENGAFEFDGINDYINLRANFDYPQRTINLWFYSDTIDQIERHIYISDNPKIKYGFTQIKIREIDGIKQVRSSAGIPGGVAEARSEVHEKEWYMITLVADEDSVKHYLNSNLIGKFSNWNITSMNGDTSALLGTSRVHDRYFNGKIDDVKIYNRTLNPVEITSLYNEGKCIETVHDTIPVYNTISVYDTISVYNTISVYDTISVYNSISVYDTIPVYNTISVYDTIPVYHFISVTDTLVINTGIINNNPLAYANTIKIYPNPAKDHLYINTKSINNDYNLCIINSLGEKVFETRIEQTLYTVNLANWTGKGIYFVQLFDSQQNLIEVKKIILK
jgi:hypothetical protein